MSKSQPPAPRKLVDPHLRRTIVRSGAPRRVLGDAYHALLNAHWSVLLAIFAAYYLVANALFALAYLAGGDDLANARPHSFVDDFFFSQRGVVRNSRQSTLLRNRIGTTFDRTRQRPYSGGTSESAIHAMF